MLNIIEKLENVEADNVKLNRREDFYCYYEFIHGFVNEVVKNGLGYEKEVLERLDSVNKNIESVEELLNKIDDFKQDIIKIKNVMLDDKWRLENSIDKEISEEFFTSYEIHTSTWKPYNKWEESEVIATMYEVSNRKVTFESGEIKVYPLEKNDLYRIKDKWSNRKEFNQQVKELAKQRDAIIIKK
jgi:hypothetical protein